MCRLASEWGYDGLEIACWGDHFQVDKALADDSYVQGRKDILVDHGLQVWAISNHLVGQAMKDSGTKSLRAMGGLTLCHSLLKADLVDRFRVVVFRVITGSSGRDRIYDG